MCAHLALQPASSVTSVALSDGRVSTSESSYAQFAVEKTTCMGVVWALANLFIEIGVN